MKAIVIHAAKDLRNKRREAEPLAEGQVRVALEIGGIGGSDLHYYRDSGFSAVRAEEAAMAEPLSVCLHATRRAGGMVGQSVLVTGCGPIGALCILAARRAGADRIVATDLAAFPLSIAKNVVADETIDMAADPRAMERFGADKGTFDPLYECSGAAPALVAAIAAMRPGATIMRLGLGGDMTLPMQAITAKELTIKGSFRFHDEFFTAVSLMRKGLIDVKPLITHKFALDKAVEAFETAGDRSKAMKAQIAF